MFLDVRQNGTAIRIIRQLRGIKVVSMSDQLECHRSTVLRIETERTDASAETLQAIARVLDVPAAALTREEQS